MTTGDGPRVDELILQARERPVEDLRPPLERLQQQLEGPFQGAGVAMSFLDD